MKAMVMADLTVLRTSIPQMVVMFFVVGASVSLGTGTPVSASACIAAMMVLLVAITLSSYDEINGWQAFRSALPISRRDTVFGRYVSVLVSAVFAIAFAFASSLVIVAIASILPLPEEVAAGFIWDDVSLFVQLGGAFLGASLVLWSVSIMLPLVARFGLTKAARYIPVAFVAIVAFGIAFLGDYVETLDLFSALLVWFSANPDAAFFVVVLLVLVFTLAVFAASAVVAAKLYETREL